MGGYLVNFSVYTFAMIGFLFLAVAIYKKTSIGGRSGKKGLMEVEDTLILSPRKNLHVVRVEGERFLIAADTERTEFLSKLSGEESLSNSLCKSDNLIKLNKHPKLVSGQNKKVSSILEKKFAQIKEKIETQGNVALKTQPEVYPTTRLSQVKNINLKKPPMMREILRKLEV